MLHTVCICITVHCTVYTDTYVELCNNLREIFHPSTINLCHLSKRAKLPTDWIKLGSRYL